MIFIYLPATDLTKKLPSTYEIWPKYHIPQLASYKVDTLQLLKEEYLLRGDENTTVLPMVVCGYWLQQSSAWKGKTSNAQLIQINITIKYNSEDFSEL